MKKFLFGALTVLAVAALLAACGKKNPVKYLVMGTNAEFPPFETRGGADGSAVVGFDVEVAQAIAAKVGLPLKIEEMDVDSLLPALNAGQVDLVLRGVKITPERTQSVDFSAPYYKATQVVLVLAGSTVPETKEQLKGRRIGVQLGATGDATAVEITGQENVRRFNSAKETVVALMNSQADAVLIDEQPVLLFLKKNPELMRAPVVFDDEFYGVAVKKGNAELLAKVNAALAEISADGRYDQFVDQWMVQMMEVPEVESGAAESAPPVFPP